MSLLDVSSLESAILSFKKAIEKYEKSGSDDFIRDALIKRFEYTYELSTKMLKRYLEMTEANAETIEQTAFPDMIRIASERGLLLHGWESWSAYRKARNTTSHAYDEDKAVEIAEEAPAFLEEVDFLLKQLKQRI